MVNHYLSPTGPDPPDHHLPVVVLPVMIEDHDRLDLLPETVNDLLAKVHLSVSCLAEGSRRGPMVREHHLRAMGNQIKEGPKIWRHNYKNGISQPRQRGGPTRRRAVTGNQHVGFQSLNDSIMMKNRNWTIGMDVV